MARSLFLLTISCIATIISSPVMLSAADEVVLTGLDPEGIVETIPLPEPEPEPEPVYQTLSTITYTAVAPAPVILPANNIQINGRTIELGYTGSTGEDAGGLTYAWYYSSETFIYGHNSANVFGFLNSAYDGNWLKGMNFSVNMNGGSQNYTVLVYRLYDYDASQPYYLWYNGGKTKMGPIIGAQLDGTQYRMAIMTCYAGSSKRLVVFAN